MRAGVGRLGIRRRRSRVGNLLELLEKILTAVTRQRDAEAEQLLAEVSRPLGVDVIQRVQLAMPENLVVVAMLRNYVLNVVAKRLVYARVDGDYPEPRLFGGVLHRTLPRHRGRLRSAVTVVSKALLAAAAALSESWRESVPASRPSRRLRKQGDGSISRG
jgi:hypothetical protein